MRTERRLVAILAADLVGYSRMIAANEAGTLAALRTVRTEIFEPAITEHGGRIVKTTGDGLLVEFPSAVDAMGCAMSVQSAMAKSETGLRFRIGVNVGDVVIEGGDILGDAVNIAARLEAVAEPGGVALSDAVREHVVGRIDTAFCDGGRRELKNIDRPIQVWRWEPSGVSLNATSTNTGSEPPLPEKPSIAVLPFDNMSSDLDQEYFADGVTEDIITELSRFPSLFVIARNSTFSYKGKSVDLKQVGCDLGVHYILEGSIRRAANRVRITAQLIDSTNGAHIWAERYDRELEDIFDLQEEITQNVAGAIAPQIEMAELARVHSGKAARFSGYDLALKAQALFYDAIRSGDADLYQKAIETAKDALAQDPRCTHAFWILGWAYGEAYLYRWGHDPDEALQLGWDAMERFFEIGSNDPRAHMSRGLIQHFRGDYESALDDFRRAFELNPNYALNLFAMAWCESLTGFTKEAREHAALGLRLSPRDNEVWLGCAYLALAQAGFADGDFAETRKWAALAIQKHPRAPIRRALMISCCIHDGDAEAAKKHVEFLNSFAPAFIPSVLQGDVVLFKLQEHNALLVEGLSKAVP